MTGYRSLQISGAGLTLVLAMVAFGSVRGGPRVVDGRRVVLDTAPPPPPSAALLRRLAESADAFRTGSVVYLVAADVAPYYRVVGGFTSRDTALAVAAAMGPSYYVYATQTPPTIVGFAAEVLPGCYKNDRTTEWVCPPKDSTRTPTGTWTVRDVPAMLASEVTRIEVVFKRRTGPDVRVSLPPEDVGAMIFSVDAFDRFIVPYYTRMFGPGRAEDMRNSLLNYVRVSTRRAER